MANVQKREQIDILIDLLQKSKNFAVIKFEKTLHKTLEALRKDLRKNSSKLTVVKNSLFQKALNKLMERDNAFKELRDKVSSTNKDRSAVLILGEEWNKGLGTFFNFAKKEESLSFKMGILDNTVYEAQQLNRIAQLPSREQLIAKVIGSMKTPISKFNYSIKYNMQKFVYILAEKSKQTPS